MKACDDCRSPIDGELIHPESVACNWLDDQDRCPHCGGELRPFRGTALGDMLDGMAVAARHAVEAERN